MTLSGDSAARNMPALTPREPGPVIFRRLRALLISLWNWAFITLCAWGITGAEKDLSAKLFYMYLVIGVLHLILFQLITKTRYANAVGPRTTFFDNFFRVRPKRGFVWSLRYHLHLAFYLWYYVIGWPAFAAFEIVSAASTPTPVDMMQATTHYRLYRMNLVGSLTIFLIIVILSDSNISPQSPDSYIPYLICLLISGVTSKHFSYFFHPEPLPKRLRSSVGRPWIKMVGIGIFDCLSLLIGYAALFARDKSHPIAISSLYVASHKILSFVDTRTEIFQSAIDAFHSGGVSEVVNMALHFSLFDFATLISGSVFSVTAFRVAWDWREFRRRQDDYIAIASYLIDFGQFREAEKYLEYVKDPCGYKYALQVGIFLGTRRFEEMRRAAFASRRMLNIYDTEEAQDGTYREIFYAMLYCPVALGPIIEVLRHAARVPIRETYMRWAIGNGLHHCGLSLEAALDLFKEGQTADAFPITVARLRAEGGYEATVDAVREINAKGKAERFYQLATLCSIMMNNVKLTVKANEDGSIVQRRLTDKGRAALGSWFEDYWGEVEEIMGVPAELEDRVERDLVASELVLLAGLANALEFGHRARIDRVLVDFINSEKNGREREHWEKVRDEWLAGR